MAIPKPKRKTEAQVTAEIKFAIAVVGLDGFIWKHWSGMGSRKGVSDLIGTLPPYGRGVFIEIKRPGGELSDHQIVFLRKMKAGGALVGVVRSVGDLRDLLIDAGYKSAAKLRFADS